ncbi:MAG TPA: hypothetical protein VLX92_22315 [Kofleriaceae bacterium]|nr:hypothetical protein [Kofleriaceae bacterium]
MSKHSNLEAIDPSLLAAVVGGDQSPPYVQPQSPSQICGANGVKSVTQVGGLRIPVGPPFSVNLGPLHAGGGSITWGGAQQVTCNPPKP